KNNWEAAVSGTSIYNALIKLAGNEIKKNLCTCRYFEQHEECKHVIAVLYAIREKKANPEPEAAKEKKAKEPKI
ncbi:SWIM zinc finger family protein, partial [Vibrio parahaemolyticus]